MINAKPDGAFSLLRRLKTYKNNTPLVFPGRDAGGFIPDPRLKGSLSIRSVIDAAVDKELIRKIPDLNNDIAAWLAGGCRDDDFSKELFPFRSKGDKTLRRTRFHDLHYCFNDHPQFTRWILRAIGLDYVRALNTLHYLFTIPQTYGVEDILFCQEITDLDKMTEKLTNVLKASDCEDGWELFVELKCLTGYRLSPWPGFDETESTRELASGYGDKHDMFFSFAHWLKVATVNAKLRTPKHLTLRAWIEAGEWITAGSSSEGHLSLTFNGQDYRVKCRKNFVLDVLTVDDLMELSETGKQVSKAFAKNELGKVRIAVCSDIGTYLLMSWFCHVCGSSYKSWKWTTRNETGTTKLTRMQKMVHALRLGLFGMAWDYKGFERQVRTAVMIDMLEHFAVVGDALIPDGMRVEFEKLKKILLDSFNDAILVSPDGKNVFKVTGGLQSGLFITSSTGDAVGLSAAEAALSLLATLGIERIPDDLVWIQGDDASYVDGWVPKLQLIDWVLDAMDWRAATGKFGITTGRTEFLRVAVTSTGCRGYIARAIASLTQRKPWSDSPPTQMDEIEALVDAANTVYRRGGSNIGDKLLRIWCRKHKVSYIVARTPRIHGGLGLSEPILWTRVPVVKYGRLPSLNADIKTTWRVNELEMLAEKVNLSLSKVEFADLAQKQIAPVIIGDNVKGVRNEVRKTWNEQISQVSHKVIDTKPLLLIETKLPLEPSETDYGSYSYVDAKIGPYSIFDIDKKQLERELVPEFTNVLGKKGSGNLTIADHARWLKGDLPVYIAELNPLATDVITKFTAMLIDVNLVPKGRLSDIWIAANFRALAHTRKTKFMDALLW